MGGARASGGSGIESGSVGGVLGITVPGAPGSGMGCEGGGMLSRADRGTRPGWWNGVVKRRVGGNGAFQQHFLD